MTTELPTKAKYVRLGSSGLKVSLPILGCMSYGDKRWANWVIEGDEAVEHLKEAWDMGINSFDTANVYSNGESEVLLGKFLNKYNIPRQKVVILTKVFMTVPDDPNTHPSSLGDPDQAGYVNQHGLSRKHILESIDASLERLGVDYVDVLQCHRFDPDTPISETMDALDYVVKSGKARYIGMSSCWAYQFAAMQEYARSKNQTTFVSMQDFFCPVYREEQREMIPSCKLSGVGVIPWSPLARGYVSRPHREQENTNRAKSDPNFAKFVGLGDEVEEAPLKKINEAIEEIAKSRNVSMAQVALAWVIAQPGISSPIVGSTRKEAIKELVQASHLELTEDELKKISEPYKPRNVLGHS
ncbi:aldo/keto reductase [Sporobolomyces salmoneus]|uniref:aldo/keto reductase n=1 Tax=Sporobolomyces salmoneus TaxID=183962 RepID=UPI00317801E9